MTRSLGGPATVINVRNVLGRYAWTIIPHPNEEVAGILGQFDLDTGRREANGVIDKVRDDVLNGGAISMHDPELAGLRPPGDFFT